MKTALLAAPAHGDAALRKLIEAAGDDASPTALLNIALESLSHKSDEKIATQLLFSILLHEELAEALNGGL